MGIEDGGEDKVSQFPDVEALTGELEEKVKRAEKFIQTCKIVLMVETNKSRREDREQKRVRSSANENPTSPQDLEEMATAIQGVEGAKSRVLRAQESLEGRRAKAIIDDAKDAGAALDAMIIDAETIFARKRH